MTFNEAAYNVLNLVRGGISFNDDNLSIDQIKYILEYHRARIIRRTVDKGDRTKDFEQDLGVVPCNLTNREEFTQLQEGESILKTDLLIPRPVRLKDRDGITFIGSPDRRFVVPLISYHAARWQRYNKYTYSEPRAFFLNGHVYVLADGETIEIYFTGDDGETLLLGDDGSYLTEEVVVMNPLLKRYESTEAIPLYGVSIRGIFEQPRVAYEFATGIPFNDDRDEYPLPYDLIPDIATMILDGELRVMSGRPVDTEANHLPDSQIR